VAGQQGEASSVRGALKAKVKYRPSTEHRGKKFRAGIENHPAG
jgi:hypothetical protein